LGSGPSTCAATSGSSPRNATRCLAGPSETSRTPCRTFASSTPPTTWRRSAAQQSTAGAPDRPPRFGTGVAFGSAALGSAAAAVAARDGW